MRFGRRKTTITIARTLQQVAWVEEHFNQTQPFCIGSGTDISKYTIEIPPGGKKISGK
jgi:hypothetical protein